MNAKTQNAKPAPVGLISSAASQRLLEDRREQQVATPWGKASVLTGRIGGREAAVVLRYGPKLTIPSHKINYRANIWALRELGVQRIISQNASGSVNGDFKKSFVNSTIYGILACNGIFSENRGIGGNIRFKTKFSFF